MKSGKFSPLLVALLLGLAASLSGLAYVIMTDTAAMVNNAGLEFPREKCDPGNQREQQRHRSQGQ